MRTLLLLGVAALSLGGCARKFLDMEAFERTTIHDPNASRAVGSDAEPKLSVNPGEEHYVERGFEGRQVHFYSLQRNHTTVLEAKALRDGRIHIVASYPGPPPPPDGWKP